MGKLKQIMVLVMTLSILTFTSCSKDDVNESSRATEGTITAKVDGTVFTSASISSAATLAQSANILILQGSDSSGRAVLITVNAYNGPGTYQIDGSVVTNINTATYTEIDINNPSNPDIWLAPYEPAVNGTVTIDSETDTNIQGTFDFNGKEQGGNGQKSITEGSFNLSKQTT